MGSSDNYSTWMADINDKKAANLYKILSLVLPVIVTSVDAYFLAKDEKNSQAYIFLRYGTAPHSNAKPGYALTINITLVFIIMLILQWRIEMDRFAFKDSNSLILRLKQTLVAIKVNPMNPDNSSPTYTIKIIRLIFILASLVFFYGILSAFFPNVVNGLYVSLLSYCFLSAVCPGIFIAKHPGMMRLLTEKYGTKVSM